jgi:nickel-dependent lactate racemase
MMFLLKYGHTAYPLNADALPTPPLLLEPRRPAAGRVEPRHFGVEPRHFGVEPRHFGDEAGLIRAALAQPIASPPLAEIVTAGQKAVIVTSDITRPCPSRRLLPAVLDELNRGGVRDEDVTVVFGLGAHRPHTPEERARLAGEAVCRRVRCVDSDPADVQLIGHTTRGTPVAVFRPVLEADVHICLGAIEYHYFAGFSGGYKAIIPGVCSVEGIQHNHRMMCEPGATAGRLDGNPVREDLEEAGALVGVHFILNVILDESRRIVSAVAGHPRAAHRAGCDRLNAFGQAVVERPADVVVVSAGGYPKDINLYQAQKALENACQIVRPGGIVVLVAECREGLGNRVFEAWMQDPGGPDAILARIKREFVLGGHKAAALARAMQRTPIYLVSALPADYARALGFYPFDNPQDAFAAALAHTGPAPGVIIMPEGGSVLPVTVDW